MCRHEKRDLEMGGGPDGNGAAHGMVFMARRRVFFLLALLPWFVMLQGALALWCGPKRMKVVRSWEPDRPADGDGLAMKLTVTCLSGLPPLWLHVEDELAAEVSLVRNSGRAGKLYFSGFSRVYSGTYHMEEINRGFTKTLQ